MWDVIVVGGGIVGMSVAYHLVCAGVRTLLFDRRDEGRATDAGAGILGAEIYSGASDAWFNFAYGAFRYYPALIEALQSDRAGETGFARCGMLLVAAAADEMEPFEYARRNLLERQGRPGAPAPEDLYEVSPEEAAALFPPLTRVRRALYYRDAMRIDGRLMERALRRAAEQRGLGVYQTGVDRLVLNNATVCGVETRDGRYDAPRVVIAGGAWSQIFGDQIGTRIPVQPQRGQIVHLDLGDTDTAAWPAVMAFHDHYLLPWPDHRVAVGATRETGAGFHPRTTAAGIHEVLTEALRLAPGIGSGGIREIRVGLRPLTVDGLPVLGAAPNTRGVYLATGHGPAGLSLGPFSGKAIADLITGAETTIDTGLFAVSRFSNV